MNWYRQSQEGQIVNLDLSKDPVFLNADNPIDEQQIRFYENRIREGKTLEPVGVVYIKVVPTIFQELGCSNVIPMNKTAKPGDWIYVLTNGHHRALASKNLGKQLSAKIVRVM